MLLSAFGLKIMTRTVQHFKAVISQQLFPVKKKNPFFLEMDFWGIFFFQKSIYILCLLWLLISLDVLGIYFRT